MSTYTNKRCNYKAIYNFGDAISDTGNLIREVHSLASYRFAHFPYGQTINEATGRSSDGLLMIDYLTNKVGLGMLEPYLDKSASFKDGVNFAVAGATALANERLMEKGISSPVTSTNNSLTVQLDWFKDYLGNTCSNGLDCLNKLKNSIFMVGEIGGNDINYAILQGKTIPEVQSLVHDIVDNIVKVTQTLINLGATQLVVPGNFPIGCFPIHLTAFEDVPSMSYDKNLCIKEVNELAMYQNQYLQRALKQLRKDNPDVVILYADYYKAFQHLLDSASEYGFDEAAKFDACCGTGGDYNFDSYRRCGNDRVPVCSNPGQYISWDGVHPTQMAYQVMAGWLIENLSFFRCIN
ncbi:hypothetical protein AQUCO_00200316v1 [Aquilegia coerulea]|uniref:Uncharacterized protein n=1 Tax=Aquilegia coerulea TaxID=218851 RepID=A0A2G5F2W5_AQUCA|nr:hypothetical protein AQUCO_00200316v1 [Aquilegia coerulea]